MQTALYIAQIIISTMLIVLVIVQARSPGFAQNTSSIPQTRRGLEKTLHQTTITLSIIFLLLALINSLPIQGL